MPIRRFLGLLFLSSLIFCLWLDQVSSAPWQKISNTVATTEPNHPHQLVQKGVELYQKGDFLEAIENWQTALSTYQSSNNDSNSALVLENLARAYQQIGKTSQGISHWEQAINHYRELENWQQVGRLLTEQAQSYSRLGQSQKAIAILCGKIDHNSSCTPQSALGLARTHQDKAGEAAALGSLGDAYRLQGDYNQAIAQLQNSLQIANEIKHLAYHSSALNSLGNAHSSRAQLNYRRVSSALARGSKNEVEKFRKQAAADDSQALRYFQESLQLTLAQNDQPGKMRSLLNALPIYYRQGNFSAATQAREQVRGLWDSLPDSQQKVYAAINLARLLQGTTATSPTQCLKPEQQPSAIALLQQAVAIAQRLEDHRSESFALGELGHIFECRQDYQQALNFTQQAQLAADQNLLAQDSLYLWAWQAGRIFKAQSQESEAIKAYERAIATLDDIRDDILTTNRDVQFDFRDTIAPLYRQFSQLRLERASLAITESENLTKELDFALKTIDSLKLAELQNYFGNDCVLVTFDEQQVDQLVGEDTAVFSSIILNNRTAVVVTLPNQEKKLEWIDIDRETLTQQINEFRRGLEDNSDIYYNPQPAQELYNQIIKPFAADLDQAQVKTLVFIQDGILRSVPMAALHDGTQFLVEKYAIATTPSLTLTDPKALNREELQALALGLTKAVKLDDERYFRPLPNVESELSEVEALFPDTKKFLNEDFTRDRLKQELNQTAYPIIHIATHGQFSTDPEDTFLVTGNNQKLTLTELDDTIRSVSGNSKVLELLALTACQTAVGDDRAALGLAGVAIQAGARSALASLWFIPDASTKTLVTEFYRHLHNSGVSKAEALRIAQGKLIEAKKYAHPKFWAPFILIGNWL